MFLQTRLYIPFTDLEINDSEGEMILYENLVQSGPAYQLIVHESPAWLRIKDKMPGMIEIIDEKKAQWYKDVADQFFSPITEVIPPQPVKDSNDVMQSGANVVTDLRRALSYFLIAHDYKARIFEDDILKYGRKLSDELEKHQNVFSEESIRRVKFVENLIFGYKRDTISTISANRDPKIFKDLLDLLNRDEVRIFSERNYLFGLLKTEKELLKREIGEKATELVKNEWFPYLTGGVALCISYYVGDIGKAIIYLSGLGAKVLSKFDFREYAPPVESPQLFRYMNRKEVSSLSYKPFNYEMAILVRHKK